MTTQGAVNRFQRLLQETSSRFFNTTGSGTIWAVEIINDSVEDIFEELRSINPELLGMAMAQTGYTVNVREPSPSPLSASTVFVEKVEVTDIGGPPYPTLREITFKDIGKYLLPAPWLPQLGMAGQAEPMAFYIRQADPSSNAAILGFDPIPQRTAVNNVNIYYNVLPSTVTAIDTTVIDLPLDFHRLVPLRMAVLACGADASPRVSFFTGLYNSALEKALEKASKGRTGVREEFEVV
jgi:hypothetical protein